MRSMVIQSLPLISCSIFDHCFMIAPVSTSSSHTVFAILINVQPIQRTMIAQSMSLNSCSISDHCLRIAPVFIDIVASKTCIFFSRQDAYSAPNVVRRPIFLNPLVN